MERAGPPPGPGRGKVGTQGESSLSDTPTLAALGVTKKESARAQLLAGIPRGHLKLLAGAEDTKEGLTNRIAFATREPKSTAGTQSNPNPGGCGLPVARPWVRLAGHAPGALLFP